MEEMTKEKAMEYYAGGIDCSQVVFQYGAEILGLDKEVALRVASAFGGGMFHGETCGCVTGALMAIGYAFGQYKPGDEASKAEMMKRKAEFEEAFEAINGSLICREIIGFDISKPDQLQEARDSGVMMDLCPKLACDACDILDEIL